ncbi:MAG: MlaD family protein [Balneolaceae bacterium]|nr:MlaD family protein [Balneolaceae bacterium]
MNLSNEMKVAITIVVAIVVAVLGFRAMRDLPLFRQSKIVYTSFNTVSGMSVGNAIYINGVKVGSVNRVQLAGRDSVQVTLSLDLGIMLPKGSVAYLESSGLLDEKAIVIERGDADEEIPYGGYIKGVYRGGMMETLKEEGEKLSDDFSQSFDKLNKLLEQINATLTDETSSNFNKTMNNLRATTAEISDLIESRRTELSETIEHTRNFTANLDSITTDNRQEIDSLMVNLNSTLNRMDRLSSELTVTSEQLNDMLVKINQGEGSLGKLVTDDSLYINLNGLSQELKNLVKNINDNPRKYLKHMRLIEVF